MASRLGNVAAFVAATAVAILSFSPVGAALGELSFGIFESLVDSGYAESTAAFIPLLGFDVLALLLIFGVSFAGGVRLPSGLTQTFFGVFVPLSLSVLQVRFFELSGDPGNLSESFGTYNFVAMFVLSIALSQLGVHLSRRRFEARQQ